MQISSYFLAEQQQSRATLLLIPSINKIVLSKAVYDIIFLNISQNLEFRHYVLFIPYRFGHFYQQIFTNISSYPKRTFSVPPIDCLIYFDIYVINLIFIV